MERGFFYAKKEIESYPVILDFGNDAPERDDGYGCSDAESAIDWIDV